MVKANVVNPTPACLKQAEFCEKLPGKSEFLALKTTVNYNRKS